MFRNVLDWMQHYIFDPFLLALLPRFAIRSHESTPSSVTIASREFVGKPNRFAPNAATRKHNARVKRTADDAGTVRQHRGYTKKRVKALRAVASVC